MAQVTAPSGKRLNGAAGTLVEAVLVAAGDAAGVTGGLLDLALKSQSGDPSEAEIVQCAASAGVVVVVHDGMGELAGSGMRAEQRGAAIVNSGAADIHVLRGAGGHYVAFLDAFLIAASQATTSPPRRSNRLGQRRMTQKTTPVRMLHHSLSHVHRSLSFILNLLQAKKSAKKKAAAPRRSLRLRQ